MTALTPIDRPPNAAQKVNDKLVARVQHLEAQQVGLRVEMNQRALDQDRLLFTARQTNQRAQVQLHQHAATIEQQNQQIGQQTGRIDHLQARLNEMLQERNALQIQLNQQVGVNQQAQGYIQQRLEAANQRIRFLEQQVTAERIRTIDEVRLTELIGEKKRIVTEIKTAEGIGVGGGGLGGMFIGLLAGGIFGGIIGFYAGAGTGSATVSCNTNSLERRRDEISLEIALICQRLGWEEPKT